MRSNRLWIGVTCGLALALSVVAAVDAGTQTAGAQAKGEPTVGLAQGQKHEMDTGPVKRWFASVKSDGTCNDTSPGVSCNRTRNTEKGDYVVTFPESVWGCAWTATSLVNQSNEQDPGEEARVAVTARVADSNETTMPPVSGDRLVRVWVFSIATPTLDDGDPNTPPPPPAGTALLTNAGFSLQVLCNTTT